MPLEITFRINRDEVLRFAELTGDWNSLHLDEQFARRSRYRRSVVHGMLPFSWLAFLAGQFSGQALSFRKLAVQFSGPVFIGDEIRFSADWNETESGRFSFTARWLRVETKEALGEATGEFSLEAAAGVVEPATGSFLTEKVQENTYSIGDLADKKESFEFRLTEPLAACYGQMLARATTSADRAQVPYPSPNLLATLLVSTLIGMRLPGRYATFVGFELGFDQGLQWNRPYSLLGSVEKISAGRSRLSIALGILDGNTLVAKGKCASLVNPAPRPMISSSEIKTRHLDFGLRDKVVLITGASRGIGEVTAKLFAMLGARVAVNFNRGKTDAFEIVNEIRSEGGQAMAVQCDVSDSEQVSRMVRSVLEEFGDLDVLVNNAVKDVDQKSLLDLEWSDFQGELDVSLKGLHHCCKAVIPIFQKKQRGKIVNLSTITTDSPVSGQAKYIAAKSAVVGYTRSLAREFAKDNIQANMVSPSLTETDLLAATLPPAVFQKLTEERTCGRNVQPIEVAQSIVFLASDWAGSMNGQKLVLNLGEDPFL